MRILYVSNYWYPERGAASRLGLELCKTLADLGHRIEVVTGFPRYKLSEPMAEYAGKDFLIEDVQGIRTIRVATPHASGERALKRGLDWMLLPRALKKGIDQAGECDVVYTVLPPVTMAHAAAYAAKRRGAPLVTMYGDIFPNNVIELGALSNPLLIKLCRRLEQYAYRVANKIIVHSDCYKDYMCGEAGVPPEKVSVVFNWADTQTIQPTDLNNEFRAEHGLGDKFVVSYAGTMGPAQGLGVVIDAAEKLQDRDDIQFVLAGEGQARAELESMVNQKSLKNLLFLPMQPLPKYIQLMAASNVSLVTLDKKVSAPTVPSKIWEIMASGRPVVAAVDVKGDVPKILERSKAGIAIPPGNADALVETILKLKGDSALAQELGANGRTFVEREASLEPCAAKYLSVFESAIKEK